MNDKIMICIMEYIHIYIFVYKPTAKNQNEYQRYMLYIYIYISQAFYLYSNNNSMPYEFFPITIVSVVSSNAHGRRARHTHSPNVI